MFLHIKQYVISVSSIHALKTRGPGEVQPKVKSLCDLLFGQDRGVRKQFFLSLNTFKTRGPGEVQPKVVSLRGPLFFWSGGIRKHSFFFYKKCWKKSICFCFCFSREKQPFCARKIYIGHRGDTETAPTTDNRLRVPSTDLWRHTLPKSLYS